MKILRFDESKDVFSKFIGLGFKLNELENKYILTYDDELSMSKLLWEFSDTYFKLEKTHNIINTEFNHTKHKTTIVFEYKPNTSNYIQINVKNRKLDLIPISVNLYGFIGNSYNNKIYSILIKCKDDKGELYNLKFTSGGLENIKNTNVVTTLNNINVDIDASTSNKIYDFIISNDKSDFLEVFKQKIKSNSLIKK